MSVYEFGRKQRRIPKNCKNATAAEGARHRALLESAYPVSATKRDGRAQPGGEVTATIYCAGWWYTLEWLYCHVPARIAVQYTTIGTDEEPLGRDEDVDTENMEAYACSFDSGPAAWNAVRAGCYVKRVGTPPQPLKLEIYEDDSDKPGSSLGSGEVAASGVGTAFAWIEASFSSAVSLTANTKYWVGPSTDGMDASNYYMLALDGNAGYAGGASRRYNNSQWNLVDYGRTEMPFRLYTGAAVDIAYQIANIARSHGQFFGGVDCHVTAGITTESYRDGSNDAADDCKDLMEMTTSNYRRILANVDTNRHVRIYEEPEIPLYPHTFGDRTFSYMGRELDPSTCPVGMWAQDGDGLPASVNRGQLSGLAWFVERCKYDAEQDALSPEPLVDVDRYDMIPKE